ncbi:MAG: Re/Si-specific NAD(P)(+) transhydrogenase subunit alpha [Candidatus Hydrogenedentota bacterium]|nr:MAG: Re/Si-specific NAD(P)(+) transhydrogenase subunit alpha [Candidatus Hydrogenedentota bacterium]
MKIAVAKESMEGEKRVALVPDSVKKLSKAGYEIIVEKEAGLKASFYDEEYKEAGASILDNFAQTVQNADIIFKVRPPTVQEIEALPEGSTLISFQDIINKKDNLALFEKKKLNTLAVEFIPRITLAQSMDVLSSMATVAGYRAVLEGVHLLQRFMPMLMTAAGTIPPAKVLVLGAGVAGLQAIATAKRLGAVVEAFDVRPAAKEQVESLGAKFVEMELDESMQDDQGYAKEASEEFIRKEMELIHKHLQKADLCITTAQVFGKKAPILVKDYMVKDMRRGSVIIDLAAEQGGNCELTRAGEIVEENGVFVYGPKDLISTMAEPASRMYSKNMENLILYLLKDKEAIDFDAEDEIIRRTTVTKQGVLVSELVKKILGG